MRSRMIVAAAVASGLISACTVTAAPTEAWEPIFDGQSLNGWTPKISGQALGQDEHSIFTVEAGELRVSYDGYETFDGEFGHLFFDERLSSYQLRFEYRFAPERTPGGPDWAYMNSGVMVHSQAPETMRVDQDFPISVEAQFLGKGPVQPNRTTANVCTPGTDVVIAGELTKIHCINSETPAFPAGEWVMFEITVQAGELIRQSINGQEAFLLTTPSFDSRDPDVQRLGLKAFLLTTPSFDSRDPDVQRLGLSGNVTDGYISLQAESHALAFRNIELKRLD